MVLALEPWRLPLAASVVLSGMSSSQLQVLTSTSPALETSWQLIAAAAPTVRELGYLRQVPHTHTGFRTADAVLLLATEYCFCKKYRFLAPRTDVKVEFDLELHGSVDVSMRVRRTSNRPEPPARGTALEPTAIYGRQLAFTY